MMIPTRTFRGAWAIGVVAALLLGLNGCGSSKDSKDAAASKTSANVGKKHVSDPGKLAPEDMVAAVSAGKGGPPVGLKFELRAPPQAGQMLDMDLVILPDAPSIERIIAKFQGSDGLDLVEGGDLAAVDKPAQGSVIRHVVRVLPKQDGIYTVSAAVSVDLTGDSITRTFTIPVIVGEGLPELSANSDVTGQAATAGTGSKTH